MHIPTNRYLVFTRARVNTKFALRVPRAREFTGHRHRRARARVRVENAAISIRSGQRYFFRSATAAAARDRRISRPRISRRLTYAAHFLREEEEAPPRGWCRALIRRHPVRSRARDPAGYANLSSRTLDESAT